MLIIGITGTLGAGKGTIVEHLVRVKNFRHFSVRNFLLDRIKERGLPENRDSMVSVANELRRSNSPSYIIDQLYSQAEALGSDAIIESIRTPGEIESLQNKGSFWLFAVDADARTRYDRIRKRQSETDSVDFRTFLDNEAREMSSDDPNSQNLRRCIEMADFRFDNNGSVGELLRKVDRKILEIEKMSGKAGSS